MASSTEWVRHCILHSSDKPHLVVEGFVFIADGAFVVSGIGAFARGEAINLNLGAYHVSRTQGSDILHIKNVCTGTRHWFEFHAGLFRRWLEVTPLGKVSEHEMPPPLPKRHPFLIWLQQAFIGFGYGLRNQAPPQF
jgi:hypothetical protein